MGSSKKPKQPVTDYYLSIHVGVALELDSITGLLVNDKFAWQGEAVENQVVVIDQPDMFGGVKKEGGVSGLMHVLLGKPDQVIPEDLAARLGRTSATCPGFRGLSSVFFTGGGGGSMTSGGGLFSSLLAFAGRFTHKGFYWGSNTGYLKPMSIRCRRMPKILEFPTWNAMVGRRTPAQSYFFIIDLNDPFGGGTPPVLAYQTAMSEVLEGLKSSVAAGTRIDIAICWYDFIGGAKTTLLQFPTATIQNLDTLISAVLNPPVPATVGSNQFAAAYTLALNWFSVTVGDTAIDRRSLILLTGFVDIPGPSSPNSAAAVAADMLDRDSGVFNTLDKTQVDCFVIASSGPGDADYLAVIDNTIEDGSPCYTSADFIEGHFNANGIWVEPHFDTDSLKAVIYRALFSRSRATVNPAHMILECLTNDDWGLGLPLYRIDIQSFSDAADTLFAEGFGLGMIWAGQEVIETFINDILTHIDGTYGVDPRTGRIFINLIRGGYNVNDLFELNETNCRVTRFQRKSLTETTNEVLVTWTNPDNEKEETVPAHDNANYAAQGQLVSASSNYHGVRSSELAMRLAQRDLTKLATPLAALEIEADRTTWFLKPGDVVKISYAEYGLVGLPIRIMSTTTGRPGDMKSSIIATEDVFEMPAKAYVVPSRTLHVDPRQQPSPMDYVQLGTVPYYWLAGALGDADAAAAEYPAVGSLIMAAEPGTDTRSFDLYVATPDSLGGTSYEAVSTRYQAGRALLAEVLPIETASVLEAYSAFAGDVNPTVGMVAWIGSGDPVDSELVLITSIDGAGLHLGRGVLDTCIKAWPIGTPIWFMDSQRDYIDPDARTAGAVVSYKLCPTTSFGTLALASAPVDSTTLDDRSYLPYRPANVKIGGAYWPGIVAPPNIDVTFSRRNRLLENPVVMAWTDADVTPEVGATCTARLYRVDTDALLAETTAIAGTSVSFTPAYDGDVRLEIFAVRDGMESYQTFVHEFLFSTAEYRATTGGEVRITTDGHSRLVS